VDVYKKAAEALVSKIQKIKTAKILSEEQILHSKTVKYLREENVKLMDVIQQQQKQI
jgi:hypothetical protein